MAPSTTQARWSGWSFPVRITTVFLIVAAATVTLLSVVGLRQFRDVNAENVSIRIDRAARAGTALLGATSSDFVVDCDTDGSPRKVMLDDIGRLVPGDGWDSLVDEIGTVNQGAANVFVFDTDTQSFGRIASSAKTPEGERIGGSVLEPGLIEAGHPAFQSLIDVQPFIGEVPVAGRLRHAYLTPIVNPELELIGAFAVDVGWVDDLTRVNNEVGAQIFFATTALLIALALAVGVVMWFAFRPLNQLIRLAHDLGSGSMPTEVPLTDRRGEIGYLANALAQVVHLQTDLADRAFHDDLTGLPNRAHFLHELSRRIDALHEGTRDAFALLLIDLDQFKEVNDGLGHAAGDELLVTLAAELGQVMQPGEFLARLGGDEFALITGDVATELDADQVASRLTDAINGVTGTSVAQIGVTSSIGIVLLPQQADTAEIALSHADLALYRVKRAGRAHWQFYQSTLASPVQRRVHLATELRMAIDAGQLRCEYQPIIDIATGELRGFEALARWDHPVEGSIPPSEFITVAENAGLINDLGNHLIIVICAQARAWRDAGFAVPPISINLSTTQLWQHNFLETVTAALQQFDLQPDALRFEITESVVVHHADGRSRQVLRDLSDMGVEISLDDFGTGYSSLSYLRDLEVHQLKIDRRFIAGSTPGTINDRLFGGIASLGRSLGLQIVAEGVETEAEFEMARRHGCDLAQGFWIVAPDAPQADRSAVRRPIRTRRLGHSLRPTGLTGRRSWAVRLSPIRGRSSTARTSAFQADDAGSIPVVRSTRKSWSGVIS